MISTTKEAGNRLNETNALQLVADLGQIDIVANHEVTIDFRNTQHFEPFGMLLVGSAIRRLMGLLKAVGGNLNFSLPTDVANGIAAHMGFWHSIGVDIGRAPSAPAFNDRYLSITELNVGTLYKDAGGRDPLASGVIEAEATKLAKIICVPFSQVLFEALTYSLRELIRNVVEHAMTPGIWIAGMSWPKRDYVQIAILDEGRGIRNSLADHSEFRFDTDELAIRESLRPGVTRNKGRKRSQAELEKWADERHTLPLSFFDNSGYGLYMVSTFCREAGQFLIASGSSYLATIASAEVTGGTFHRGTALRIVVEPTKVKDAFEKLFENAGSGVAGSRPLISASTLRRLGLDSLQANGDEHDKP